MSVTVKPNPEDMQRRELSIEDIAGVMKKLRRTKVEASGNKVVVTLDEPGFKRLQQVTEQAKLLKVKGIDGIKRVVIRKEPEGYVIYSEGSNLADVLEIEGVDRTRTMTNDIMAIYDVLGVEAARAAIINQAYDTLSEQGLQVDVRHLMLVADVMSADGSVKPIGRQGVSGQKTSILARAAFEITVDHLLRAGVKGEIDYLSGVAENIIVGQPVNLGTGAVHLVMDMAKLKELRPIMEKFSPKLPPPAPVTGETVGVPGEPAPGEDVPGGEAEAEPEAPEEEPEGPVAEEPRAE